jgi:hypothetical protein
VRSHCRDRISAIGSPPGSEDPERGARAEIALELEGVVYRGVHAEEALGGPRWLKLLQLTLLSSHQLMSVLSPIVLPEPRLVREGQAEMLERGGVGAHLVGYRYSGTKPWMSKVAR